MKNYPIVTLHQSGQVMYNGTVVTVGSGPTVVRAYNVKTTRVSVGSFGGYISTTQAQNALVVNTRDNSVSILNLAAGTVASTIQVGSQPVDARISPDNTSAYVVNYESGTVSKISLSSLAVVATGTVGAQPASLDFDASGDLVIGGAGYVETIDPNTLAVTATQQRSGSVSALAISQAQNQILTSTSTGSGSGQTTVVGANTLPNYSPAFSSDAMSAVPFSQSSISPSLAFPTQLASGILVSPVLNNSFAAEATPTGFLITDLETNQVLLSGNTPYPVRGMAIDATNGYFYFTMQDSNSVVTVPIPTAPLDTALQYMN